MKVIEVRQEGRWRGTQEERLGLGEGTGRRGWAVACQLGPGSW